MNIKKIFWSLLLITGFINAQTLTVNNGANDHTDSFEDPDGEIVMLQLQLSASGGDIEITDITVDPLVSGVKRGDDVDLEVRIYEDKNHNGFLDGGTDEFIAADNYGGQVNQTPTSVTVAIPNKTVLNGTTQNWLIVNTFSGASDGDDILVQVSDISVSSGSVSGTTVTGNIRTFESDPATQTGSLFIGAAGKNPIARNASNSATDEVMLQVVLATSTLESGTVTQIDFDMSGSADESTDLTNAKLYYDGDGNGILNLEQDSQIGSTVTSFTNNGVLSFTSLSEVIAAGSMQHWMVVYNFNGSATNTETFALDLTLDSDVTVTGLTVSGAPANGNTVTISATGSLTLTEGAFNPSARTISTSETELEMIQVNLAANATEDINISQIVFKTTGTANESTDIDSVILILDTNGNGSYDVVYDARIDSSMTFTDNGNITFSSLTETISAGSSEDWLLLYYLSGNGSSDETFKVYFDTASQVTATGATSSQSISPLGLPVNGFTMTISSTGTLTIAVAATNPGDVNFAGTATDLSMLAFTMAANNVEDIDITSIAVRATTNNITNNELDAVRLYEDVDQNGLLNLAIDRFINSQGYTGGGGQPPGNATITISAETIAANSSVQWLLVNTITGTAIGDYIEVSVLSSNISGTGAVSSSSVNISGPNLLGGTKTEVSGVPGTLTLNEGPQNPAYRFISAGVQNEVMLQFQLNADAVEDIDISEIKIITSGTGNESNDLTSVRLFLDGDDNGDYNALYDTQLGSTISSMTDDDTLTFSSFNDTISSGTAKNYIVVYNYNSANNTVGETFKVVVGNAYVTATGITSTSGITLTGGPANGELATITDKGTLTVSAGSNNPGATNVAASDNNVSIIQMNIAAGSNENVTITSVTFTLTGTFDDATDFESASFRLYDDDNGNGAFDVGENQLGTGQDPTADNGAVTFSGLSKTILADTDENWIVLVNLNGSASNFENFRVSFVNSTDISATGDDTGDDIYPDGVPVQGGLFTVGAEGSLSLTTGSNNPATGTENPAAQSVEMLQLKLTASGVEDIEITSITFTADGTADDLADLNDTGNGVSLYIDVNNDGQLDLGDSQIDAEGTYSANDGTINFTSTVDTIAAGTSENWLVVYDIDAAATNATTFRTGLYTGAEITATGVTSSASITPSGFPIVGNYKTITNIGTMSLFAGDNNPAVADIDATTGYEMLQIKMSVSTIEAIDVDDLTITHIGTGDPATDLATNGVQLVRDNNNNGAYDSGTDDILATTDYSGSTATFTLAPIIIPVDSTENWLVTYDFAHLTPAETYRARVTDLTDLGLTGATSLQSITASGSVPISGGTMTVNNDFGLPVKLTSFVATGDRGFINLQWITESEINNLGFSIEKKLSSQENFEMIASYGIYNNLLGIGNSSSQKQYTFNDSTVIPGVEYIYRLIQHDYSGIIHVQQILASAIAKEPLPTKFELAQNYPNPFNPETTIKVGLPEKIRIKISIFNILGQQVLQLTNDEFEAGHYKFKWDGRNQQGVQTSSGLYFYILQVKSSKGIDIIKTRKMIKLQ